MDEVALDPPVVAFPVYVIPSVVRLATPLEKPPDALSTLEPWSPKTVPVSGATGVIVDVVGRSAVGRDGVVADVLGRHCVGAGGATPSVWGPAAAKAK